MEVVSLKQIIHNKLIWISIISVIIIGISIFQTRNQDEVALKTATKEKLVKASSNNDFEKKDSIGIDNQNEIIIDIKGAVNKPGVYRLEGDRRVDDAIQLAGGFNKNADSRMINLAEKTFDEMVIYVPRVGEDISMLPKQSNHTNDEQNKDAVDINHATEQELETIPGVGPSKARNILDYIQTKGPFKNVDQLDEVNGIGKKSLEQMKPFILIR